MADPNDPDSLPTQQWSRSDDDAPSPAPKLSESAIEGMLGPRSPQTRGGWQPPTSEELQARLSQYEITDLLGRGGMGAVYKGRQKSLDRFVAIKILPPGLESGDVDFAARFKREAKAMAKLKHPGIIHVHDAGETADGLLYFVMDYVEGTDLQKMVVARGRLPVEEALGITAHILDALAYAHQHGIIHRDIKPANIMVDGEGHVLVADFGLAKSTAADTSLLTSSHMAMGTPDFMAPETNLGMDHVDHRADLYAVGVMLYYMLTGKLPRGRFDPPSRAVPGLDKRLDGIVDRTLQNERDARYSSALELRAALDPILTRTLALRAARSRGPSPRRAVFWLGVAVVLAVLIGGAIYVRKSKPRLSAPASDQPVIRGPAALEPGAIKLSAAQSPAPQWQRVQFAIHYDDTNPNVTLASEGLHLMRYGTFQPRNVSLTNAAVRATIRWQESTSAVALILRGQSPREYTARIVPRAIEVQRGGGYIGREKVILQRWLLAEAPKAGERVLFQAAAIGPRISVWLRGQLIGATEDAGIAAQGSLSVQANDGLFESMEYINLDGLPDAEALKLAQPEPNKHPE